MLYTYRCVQTILRYKPWNVLTSVPERTERILCFSVTVQFLLQHRHGIVKFLGETVWRPKSQSKAETVCVRFWDSDRFKCPSWLCIGTCLPIGANWVYTDSSSARVHQNLVRKFLHDAKPIIGCAVNILEEAWYWKHSPKSGLRPRWHHQPGLCHSYQTVPLWERD